MELAPEEMRVLGCLAEKQLTTPAQYPLTLNALTLACNQTTSRDPVVHYDERLVEQTVTRAKTDGLARFFHPSHGRSALRFGHALDEALGLDTRQLALVTVLMLRGPQTLAELRTRTQRMAEFADTRDVESDLEGLARREPPLVRRLLRQPGQKEERYLQLLGTPGEQTPDPPSARPVPSPSLPAGPLPAGRSEDRATSWEPSADGSPAGHDSRGGADPLSAEVADLRAEVTALRRHVDDLRSQLGL
ncbi:MAG TPA: YceH family protein [Acidimicrobiales bacterium]|nr:YceH family protein [Acidimicrobiales bacterium]